MTDNKPSVPEKPAGLQLPPMSRRMQRFSILMFFLLGVALTAFLVGDPLGMFGRQSSSPATSEQEAASAAEEAGQLYMCPMHPEVIESSPGSCPICKMALVEVKQSRPEETGEREVLYWYAPMDPSYVQDEPGLSPMGMKLVPKYADQDTADDSGTIRIDPTQIQNIGVVSTPAVVENISRTSRTVGILDYDAERISWVNTKFEGWIEKVHVNYVGQEVRRGQALFEIYSPDLVSTQEEYLRALEYVDSMEASGREQTLRQAEALLRSARERLGFWDISEEQVQALETTRTVQRTLTVHALTGGIVAEIMQDSLEGMYVKSGMDLYKIADLSTIWVHADIYETDLPWVREGMQAVVSFRNDPEQVYQGKVLYLYPEVNKQTRTLKVCVAVPNPKRRMRPGMYADVSVEGPNIKGAVIIPRSAVLRTGERDLVFLDLGEGRFRPQEVRMGVAGEGDRIQILEGIEAGQEVVVQAQFMLDSESRIQEAIAKFMTRDQSDD
ncbi:MAG: efflux RND transporter periplasmic adaptor subunit [Acidobacteria bacterium]|uniref:Efflux RND transporter periplasmic adaptor subunit n=1 Tax=Candidatus Polarisedimenticola svalbardensis TaxID=2886004 RepID=A0A8J7CEW9_9BACT|nr:efflux RND transporter periplasmic adaptor subunit [Candidatus Polarisedimenticola svalbardensis]